ncbi:ABC transporter permease [Ferrimonas lipolytica]|uniref:ABC transporter permease n=1 Tax=Ferrimonas lipolytica TaxID=2724191 RepID=A0A6H1UE97_9GAMM|nr:ABC transporter permease [Ferrimonas lipolytica]QIZ76663.1 ABC transporter permease [Ferrimonas lipolytica]
MINRLQPTQKCGALLLSTLLIASMLVSWLLPWSSAEQHLAATLQMPNAVHWFGTDHYGRSMMARMADAILLSFSLGIVCMLTSASIGVMLGVSSAWQGSKLTRVFDTVSNIVLAMPGLVVVLLFAAIAPGSFWAIYLAISLVQWVEYYRVVAAITRTVINSPERQSSVMMGFGKWYQFKRHIWPSLAQPVFTLAAFGGANAILTMAALGFVYVGIQPPMAELGLMAVELFPHYQSAPWILIQPLLGIALLVLGFHLLAGQRNDTTD